MPRCDRWRRARPARRHADLFRHRFRSVSRQGLRAAGRAHLAEHRAYFIRSTRCSRDTRWQVGVYGAGHHLPAPQGRAARRSISGCHRRSAMSARRNFSTAGNGICFRTSSRSSGATRADTIDTDVANPCAAVFRAMDVARRRRCRTIPRRLRKSSASRAFVKKACMMATAPDKGKLRPARHRPCGTIRRAAS